jgi:hypothetical protein
MTPEQQLIAIAEACGWTSIQQGNNSQGARLLGVSPANKGRTSYDGLILHELPDYLNDLNAMHEAEKILTDQQQATYAFLLHKNSTRIIRDYLGRDFDCIHTTASQRAEAFLKTIDKWEETK